MSGRPAGRLLRLSRGDTVGVVAPGYVPQPAALRAGLGRLQRMGFRVREGEHLFARDGYLAGTDDQRAADLRAMLSDPEVRGVWFARGGYGTARILPRVPWVALERDPKVLIGYSDLTALFGAVIRRTGQSCLYGPVVTELAAAATHDGPSLRRLLAGEPLTLRVRRSDVLVPGRARGRLVGGNLCVLVHQLGTRYAADLRGGILFLEEVGEQLYSVDRMLTQLRQSGALREVRGVLLGGMEISARTHFPPDRRLPEVLGEAFGPLGVPIVKGIRAGHLPRKRTLPLGARATIDTARGEIRFG